jgi:hypothetical protein
VADKKGASADAEAKTDKKKGWILPGQNPDSFRGRHLHLARHSVLIGGF